jgi:hypothetical protein
MSTPRDHRHGVYYCGRMVVTVVDCVSVGGGAHRFGEPATG